MNYRLADADTNWTLTEIPVGVYETPEGALHVAAVMAVRFARGGRSVLLIGAGKPRLYSRAHPDGCRRYQVQCDRCSAWCEPVKSGLCTSCTAAAAPARPKRARSAEPVRRRRKAQVGQLPLPDLE